MEKKMKRKREKRKKFYTKKTLLGGGPDALDGINATVSNDGNRAFIEETQQVYVFVDSGKWEKSSKKKEQGRWERK